MTDYQLRFLRPDDTFKRIAELDFGSDAEARTFVIENYPQRATELWAGDRRVSRRTSPRHEARLRGEYPSVSIYPVLMQSELDQLEKRCGLLTQSDFECIGRTGMAVYHKLGERLVPHGVWYRAVNHPLPPPSFKQHARFSFHVSREFENNWYGSSDCSIWSHIRDGEAVLDDLLSAAADSLIVAHETVGLDRQQYVLEIPLIAPPMGHVVRDGLFLFGSAALYWRLKRLPEAQRLA